MLLLTLPASYIKLIDHQNLNLNLNINLNLDLNHNLNKSQNMKLNKPKLGYLDFFKLQLN